MKKLTGWAAIIAVTDGCYRLVRAERALSGIPGMAGVVSSAAIIVIVSALLYVAFKRNNWI